MATPKRNANNFTSKTHVTSYPHISPLNLDLTGRYVLITGTAYASGVGYATATAFARAGASAIAIADVKPVSYELVEGLKKAATEADRHEPLIVASTVDISDKASFERLADEVQQKFGGRLDILDSSSTTQP